MTEKNPYLPLWIPPHSEKASPAPVLSTHMNEEMKASRSTHLTGASRLHVTATGETLNNAPKRFRAVLQPISPQASHPREQPGLDSWSGHQRRISLTMQG